MDKESEDICGLCGEPGADKIPMPDWVEVCRMLGADGHRLAARPGEPERTASIVLLKLRDALAFSMTGKDRERAFDPPKIETNREAR